jgi:hypothetical protein
MSMSRVLIKLELDGNSVKQYFSENNKTVVETITVTEFQRQAKLMKSLMKGSEPFPDPPAEDPPKVPADMLAVMSEFQQEIQKEMNQKYTQMMTQHKHLQDMLNSVVKQKTEVWSTLQEETSAGIESLRKSMADMAQFQQQALQGVTVKEGLIRDIMIDLEKKKEWTWESSRKNEEEIQRSLRDLRIVKSTVDASMAEAKATTQSIGDTVSKAQQKLLHEFEESLAAMKAEVASLVSTHRREILDQAARLDESNIERYKDHYFQSELERRTQIEREKSYYICTAAQATADQINVRVNALLENVDLLQKKWNALSADAEQKVASASEEERAALHKLREKLDEFQTQASQFKFHAEARSKHTQQLASLLEYLVYQVENDAEMLFDELKQLEADNGKLEDSEIAKLLLEE